MNNDNDKESEALMQDPVPRGRAPLLAAAEAGGPRLVRGKSKLFIFGEWSVQEKLLLQHFLCSKPILRLQSLMTLMQEL